MAIYKVKVIKATPLYDENFTNVGTVIVGTKISGFKITRGSSGTAYIKTTEYTIPTPGAPVIINHILFADTEEISSKDTTINKDEMGTVETVNFDAEVSRTTARYYSSITWADGTIKFSDLNARGTIDEKTKIIIYAVSSLRQSDGVMFYKIKQKGDPSGAYYWIDSVDVTRNIDQMLQEAAKIAIEAATKDITETAHMYFKTDTKIKEYDFLSQSLIGIHGAPYQFLDIVDNRDYFLSTTNEKTNKVSTKKQTMNFGRKYAERIVSNMPLVLFSPGEPDFLPNFSKIDKTNVLSTLKDLALNKETKTGLRNILSSSGRYYTFKFAYTEYYKYVNDFLRQCAVYLKIQNKKFKVGKKEQSFGSFNWEWQNCMNPDLKNFIYSQEYIAFYADSENSVSESISSSTTQSQLAASTDTYSALAKEVQFLAGPIAGFNFNAIDQDGYNATMEDIRSIATKYLGNSRLFTNLAEGFTTIGKGAKLLFPEIWDDSNFTKSYRIQLKFRTPDKDPVSWYLNICVPLVHIMCLAMPRGMGPNGYRSPFIVRANSKGLFNCEMGLITDMSITKGAEGAWTAEGLPTQVDVDITIKDLYDTLFMTHSKKDEKGAGSFNTGISNFINNTAYMDYIGNLCGININKPEIERTVETYLMLTKNKVPDYFSYKWLGLKEDISNKALKAYELLGKL